MRGKQASAAANRRAVDAQERVRRLEHELKQERQQHAVTQRIAERVERMEEACRRLEEENRLVTNSEVERLNEMVASLRERARELEDESEKARKRWAKVTDYIVEMNGGRIEGIEGLMDALGISGFYAGEDRLRKLGPEGIVRIQQARGQRRHPIAFAPESAS